MLLEPLKQLKQADARLNMTQGVLEGVGMSYVTLFHICEFQQKINWDFKFSFVLDIVV